MPDFLDDACDWLDTICAEQISQSVTYARGASSVPVVATIGEGEFISTTEDGVTETHRTRDYLILAESLLLEGQSITPERGDRITEGTRVYEVLPPGDEPAARYSDPHNRMWRIHTKLIRES